MAEAEEPVLAVEHTDMIPAIKVDLFSSGRSKLKQN